jgi:hypothetical protein
VVSITTVVEVAAPALPKASTTRVSIVCVPGASAGLTVYGLTQVVQAPPSTRHSKVPPETPPDSANDGVVSLVVPP